MQGLTLDMISPLLPIDKIIYVSAVATVCKVMCGMAAGATKASITAHFAIRYVQTCLAFNNKTNSVNVL